MRKTKRFIRNIAKKLTIYAVVFVALINACFYCPMQVQAGVLGGAETVMSIDEIDSYGPYTYITGQNPSWTSVYNLGWLNDSKHTFNVRFNIVGSGDSSFSSGNYFVWTGRLLFWGDSYDSSSASQSYFDPTVYTNWTDHNPNPLSDVSFSGGSSSRFLGGSQFGVYQNIALSGSYHEFLGSLSFEFQITLHYWGVNAPSLNQFHFRIDDQSLQVFDTRQEYEDVLEQIEHNTGETTDAINNGFDETINGYDDSSGNQVSSDFESSVGSYNEAEDSIFTSSESALDGFSFFDWSGYTGIATGVSFVSSLPGSLLEPPGDLHC